MQLEYASYSHELDFLPSKELKPILWLEVFYIISGALYVVFDT